jgi:hypothetical protein
MRQATVVSVGCAALIGSLIVKLVLFGLLGLAVAWLVFIFVGVVHPWWAYGALLFIAHLLLKMVLN